MDEIQRKVNVGIKSIREGGGQRGRLRGGERDREKKRKWKGKRGRGGWGEMGSLEICLKG